MRIVYNSIVQRRALGNMAEVIAIGNLSMSVALGCAWVEGV